MLRKERKKNCAFGFIFHIYIIMRQTIIVRILQYVATPHTVVVCVIFIIIETCVLRMKILFKHASSALRHENNLFQERLIGKLKGLRKRERWMHIGNERVSVLQQEYERDKKYIDGWTFFFEKLQLLVIFFCIQCNCSGLSIAEFFLFVKKQKEKNFRTAVRRVTSTNEMKKNFYFPSNMKNSCTVPSCISIVRIEGIMYSLLGY